MKILVLQIIKIYQKLEPFRKAVFKNLFHLDTSCKFKPTCSLYFYQAVEKYGAINGGILGVKRIFRCNPWAIGGNDPVN